jgi:Arc/MetJ-type ribon-helix-helix transcriptional regulator
MARAEMKQYSTVAIPAGLWMQVRRLVQATGSYSNEAEFVREAVREKVRAVSVVELKDMPEERVREAILNCIRKKGRAYPSDITAELGIPYFDVVEAIEKLVQEGLLVSAEETP